MTTPRARSFGAVAAAYAEHRPEYARAAVEWACEPIADRPGRRLVDLGAGTGKLTGSLLEHGPVIAVEPDPGMLDELRTRFPAVDARDGSAEAIPVADGSVDAVLVGQAWHWFDRDAALSEIARVLRPGGVLGVLWNADDTAAEWVRGYQEAATRERPVPGVRGDLALPEHAAFGPGEHSRHPNPVATTTDGLVATLATHSWALVSEPADRDAAFARVRAYLSERPETAGGEFVLPVVTEALRALRR